LIVSIIVFAVVSPWPDASTLLQNLRPAPQLLELQLHRAQLLPQVGLKGRCCALYALRCCLVCVALCCFLGRLQLLL
jgi:hypothetical protein